MPMTVPAGRSAAALVAVLVVLPGCGASEEARPASATSGPGSATASPSTDGQADPEFCTAATALQEQLVATLGSRPDPATVRTALQQAATGFRAVEPPPEIAAEWHTLGDGVEQIATALASTDVEDPGGRLQEQVGRLQMQVGTASADVGAYLRDECGIDAGGSGAATPSG